MVTARQRPTLEQFLRLPPEEPALEYWRGEVTQKVSPKGPHGALQYGFGRRIDDVGPLRRLVRVFTETRVTFAGASTVPDVIVFRRERVPRDSAGRVAEDFTVPPDIAVEVLSPGQSRRDVIERCRWYSQNGVPLGIYADPFRGIASLFRAGSDSGELRGADRLDLGEILPDFSLTVDEFFAPLAADWE